MSSLIGHTLAGASVYLSCNRPTDQRAARALPVFVLLAICPDFDYFILWLFHHQTTPRITHTLLFCLATSLIAWWCALPLRRKNVANTPFWAMVLASVSHPLLDLLVGVHPLPLLWPLPDPDIALPFGILPSAGQLKLTNYYLWRNLLIETAILLPIASLAVAIAHRCSRRAIAKYAFLVAPVWLAFVVWSVGLQR